MPQAIWRGAVSFGMVTIPVRVFAATEEKDVRFRQVHAADGGRIRYRRVCELDGEEVPYSDIAKGYEMPDGEMVILTAEDFEDLPLPSKQVVDVLEFVPADQIDPIYVGRTYYLQADNAGTKPYVLLRDALTRTGQVALVKVALRNRETLAMLRATDDVLLLQAMMWPDEVRDSEFAAPEDDVEIRDQELAMAESYIETLAGDFDPDRYHDEYREALERMIEAKTEGRVVEPTEEPEDTGEVVDLMAALRASVDAAKKRRGEGASSDGGTPKKPAAGAKSTADKSTATKKAAKKGGTEKSGTEKSGTEKPAGKKATAASKGEPGGSRSAEDASESKEAATDQDAATGRRQRSA